MGNDLANLRALSALRSLFVGDSLAMPVHWYYNPGDIYRQFPGGIYQLEDAPSFHPSSIMSLHSTSQGGRSHTARKSKQEIVGEVILKGKRQFWDVPNQHYHQGMKAGENTLNAHCVRALMQSLISNNGAYSEDHFLNRYIELLTADTPEHPDTYAESYHRGFFANLQSGLPPQQCAAVTHDTASIGGLVTLAPLVFSEYLNRLRLDEVQKLCHAHLWLTHPDETLGIIAKYYVELLFRLLNRKTDESPQEIIADIALKSIGLKLKDLCAKNLSDFEIVGGTFTSACYISGSWPSVLYFAYRYCENTELALIANTNVGGDNVHRGAVLGVIVGLASNEAPEHLYRLLKDYNALEAELGSLLGRQ